MKYFQNFELRRENRIENGILGGKDFVCSHEMKMDIK